jgi:hypothetical protein
MGTKKECEESCLGELQMQMFVVFTGKTFGLQLVELATPVIKTMIGSLLSIFRLKKLLTDAAHAVEAVALVPVKVVNSVVDVVSPASEDEDFDEKRKLDEQNAAQLRDREESFMKLDDKAMSNFELQTHMENYEEQGTFNDYNEMAIQYGYIALFSPCFPLAPMAAFMNNVTEIRGDAWQLCNVFQRPMARSQANIGAWYTVLNVIGFAAVITNATMIAFVGSQIAHTEAPAAVAGIMLRFDVAPLWVYAVLVEHGVFITRVVILLVFPTVPDWIGAAKDILDFRVGLLKKELMKAREATAEDAVEKRFELAIDME